MIYFYALQTLYFGKTVTAYTIFISLFLIFLPGDLTFTFIASYIAKKLNPIMNKMVYQSATDEDIQKFEAEKAQNTKLVSEHIDNTSKYFNEDSTKNIIDEAPSNEL